MAHHITYIVPARRLPLLDMSVRTHHQILPLTTTRITPYPPQDASIVEMMTTVPTTTLRPLTAITIPTRITPNPLPVLPTMI